MGAVAIARHSRKVARVRAQLAAYRGTRPLSLKKEAVAHQVPKAGDLRRQDDKIDIRDLKEIISIDPVRRVCIAEGGVTFVDLVRATLEHGLVPAVVPELKTITIAGAVSGCSIESSSIHLGGFHDSCLAYEVITAKGDVITCTPGDLLFQMMHGSFGTLGILSKLTFQLLPAKPFVHVEYEKHTRLDRYLESIWRHYETRDADFVDGIIHAPNLHVLSVGHFVDDAPYTHRYDFGRAYYKTTRERAQDFMRTPDYFFRYDRGVTNVHPVSSARLLRLAEKLHFLLPRRRPSITLDVFIPFSKVPEFMQWHERELGFYPLWVVPYRRVRDYEWIAASYLDRIDDELFVDLAIYGMKQRGDRNVHRMIEEKLIELGGIKTLISHNYYSEEDFWTVWNRANYQRVKRITDPENRFRDLYEKTCRAAMGRAA
jgi:FAD/FMN-containing dehydrogenase